MRVLVCGDRNWTDVDAIHNRLFLVALDTPPSKITVIHGAARGADQIAHRVARELGCAVMPFPADWVRYGRAAGPVRNRQMLVEGRPDRVLAFHNNLSESRGTADMVRRARKAGIPVEVITSHGE